MLLCCAPLRCRRVSCLPHNLFRGNIAPTPPGHQGQGRARGRGGGHHMDPAPARTPWPRSAPGWSQWPAPASNQLLLIIIFSELHYLSSPAWSAQSAQCPCPLSDIRHISSVEICGSLQSTGSPSPGTSPGTSPSSSPPTLLTATIYEELGTAAAAAACAGSSSFVRQRGGELPPFTRDSVYSWLIFLLDCSALLATGAVG